MFQEKQQAHWGCRENAGRNWVSMLWTSRKFSWETQLLSPSRVPNSVELILYTFANGQQETKDQYGSIVVKSGTNPLLQVPLHSSSSLQFDKLTLISLVILEWPHKATS